jgi:hypothetical protein
LDNRSLESSTGFDFPELGAERGSDPSAINRDLRGITVDLATIISDFFPNEWREEARNIQ